MSAKQITLQAWKCRCNLPDCPGKGKPWISRGKQPPARCRWCKRLTWNHADRRLKPKMTREELRAYNREKQMESRQRRAAANP